MTAPAEQATGAVAPDAMAAPPGDARVFAVNAHCAPAARTAWHPHPRGRTRCITEGVGLVPRRGGPVGAVHPGDRVLFEPGEEHRHGAAPDRPVARVAVLQVDDGGSAATRPERVTDEEYGQPPG